MKNKKCSVRQRAKGEECSTLPATDTLEINHENGYRENFTVYMKIIIYI